MKKYFYITIIFTTFILYSCNDGSVGLFYQIEEEETLADSIFGNPASIEDMLEYTDGTANRAFFVSSGTRLYRKTTNGNWIKDTPSDKYPMGGPLASYNNDIYVIAKNKDAQTQLLKKSNITGTWTAIVDYKSLLGSGEYLSHMYEMSNGIYFVSYNPNNTNDQNNTVIYYNGSSFTPVTFSGNTPANILGFFYDTTNYYIVTKNGYVSSTVATSFDTSTSFKEFGYTINDVSQSTFDGSFLVAGGDKGIVSFYNNGNDTWTKQVINTGYDYNRPYVYNNYLLLPSDKGYMLISGVINSFKSYYPDDEILGDYNSYLTADLDDTESRFFAEFNGTLYLGAYNLGLWHIKSGNWNQD
ncbi:hypothetical protein [Spirochaeta cellobiosiphila]|uniref:hypothetical protein n=1 Tax=Spirochaeta cellobiosiphila TaxID=504483 RepID=UPI000409C412|nr:hypothetical protein [Spirochaeta cellobiosiphila]